MIMQCRLNECRFGSYVEKKKRAKLIDVNIQAMNREFLLMQKSIQNKQKKAKELHE